MNWTVEVTRLFKQTSTYDISADTEVDARALALKKAKWNEPMPTQSDEKWKFHIQSVEREAIQEYPEDTGLGGWDVEEAPAPAPPPVVPLSEPPMV